MTSRQWQVRVIDASPQLTRSRCVASTAAARGGSRVRACVRHRRCPGTAARAATVCVSAPSWNCLERRLPCRLRGASAAAMGRFRFERHDGQRSTSGERPGADIGCSVSMRGSDRRVSGVVAAQHVEVATTSGAENTSDVIGAVDNGCCSQLKWLVDAVVVSRRWLHHLSVDAGRQWSSPAAPALTASHTQTHTLTLRHQSLAIVHCFGGMQPRRLQ